VDADADCVLEREADARDADGDGFSTDDVNFQRQSLFFFQ